MSLFPQQPPEQWISNAEQRYGTYQPPPNTFGMTTNNELCMLETYAATRFTGRGRIIDLGCWFGATTLSLARGLLANRHARAHRVVEAFDTFEWHEWMDPLGAQAGLPRRYVTGESFYEDVRELARPYDGLIRLERQDLATYEPLQSPIELLFIDAMKNWSLAQAIVSRFVPLLVAEESYVVQQDFAYYFPEMATNHLIMWYLREYFVPVHHVPYSCSVVFRCLRTPAADELPVFTPGMFTLEMIDQAYEYSLSCVGRASRIHLEVAKLNFLIEQGHRGAAVNQMARISRFPKGLTEPMLKEVERVAHRAIEAGVLSSEAQLDVERWSTSHQ